jgi:hypothetical protein
MEAPNKSQTKITPKYRNVNPYYSPIKAPNERKRPDTSPIKKTGSKIELSFAKNMIRS